MSSAIRPKHVLMFVLLEKKFQWKTNLYHMFGRNSTFYHNYMLPTLLNYFCHKRNPPKWVVNLQWMDDQICDAFLRLMSNLQEVKQPFKVVRRRNVVRSI